LFGGSGNGGSSQRNTPGGGKAATIATTNKRGIKTCVIVANRKGVQKGKSQDGKKRGSLGREAAVALPANSHQEELHEAADKVFGGGRGVITGICVKQEVSVR